MALVAITGSTTGLGLDAAHALTASGHVVIAHARNVERARALPSALPVIIGDLAEPNQVLDLVEQLRRIGTPDVVIHNAGIDATPNRAPNSLGQPAIVAVNLYAPYIMAARSPRPKRLIILSSSMHYDGAGNLDDIEWTDRRWNGTQAYCDSKLLVTTLAFALARHWSDVSVHAVDPGWVPTRMGGPDATDDLVLGHRTQVWLATSGEPDARRSGGYWFHQRRHDPAGLATDHDFQDRLLERLAAATGVDLF